MYPKLAINDPEGGDFGQNDGNTLILAKIKDIWPKSRIFGQISVKTTVLRVQIPIKTTVLRVQIPIKTTVWRVKIPVKNHCLEGQNTVKYP